jgi:hypothetical protein
MPASSVAALQLASSEAGTCSHAREVKAAKCRAVATKTSASASALGRGFSKVNRIFTGATLTRNQPIGKGGSLGQGRQLGAGDSER